MVQKPIDKIDKKKKTNRNTLPIYMNIYSVHYDDFNYIFFISVLYVCVCLENPI